MGSGAMGAVYLADDTLLHRKVALKTPTFDDDSDGELLRRFYREARAVANLKHPNLCAVYDVGEIDGRHYISMEFVRGKKLQDYIKPDKPMAEKQVMAAAGSVVTTARVARSLTDGLTATFAEATPAEPQSLPALKEQDFFIRSRIRRAKQKSSNGLLYSSLAGGLFLLLSVIFWIRNGLALVKV